MEEVTLNFFGEEAKIEKQKDLPSLKSKISEKYLISPSDVNEIILYYVKDSKKVYIINGNDYSAFKESSNGVIFLDINQNSKLYLDNALKIKNETSEKEKDQKELNELLEKYKDFSEKKKEKEIYYYNKQNEIMKEIKERRAQLVKTQHKELSKVYEQDEEYIKKIYLLQRKLSIPTTVRIPKEIKKQEEERINQEEKKKQEEIRIQSRIKREKEQKEREERRKKYQEHVQKQIEEDKKKKEIERLNKLKSSQRQLTCKQDFFPHISLRKIEEEKRKAAFKCKTIAATTAASFINAKKKNQNNKVEEKLIISNEIKEQNNKINTVPVFTKVNEILNKTVDEVKQVAIEHITKEPPKKEEDAKEKEKEKKAQIEKIKKITRDTVKEINMLTKLVIEQSNALIEKINNPDCNNLSSNDDNIILKSSKKENEKNKKKEGIHFHVSCDGCKMDPIRGNRYKCKTCPNFDFCEKCYEKNKEVHGHEFRKIERPSNTRRMGHKNTAYAGRGIVHRDIRCEGCGLEPLVGWRFKCIICDDYNLCENCEERLHTRHNHPLLKIYYRAQEEKFNDYYLKMNNYEV